MVGLLLGLLTRQHAVGPEWVRVGSGTDTEIRVPWAAVDAVARKQRRTPGQGRTTVDVVASYADDPGGSSTRSGATLG